MTRTFRSPGTIEADKLGCISVTDDVSEIVTVISEHRDWKRQKIEEARAAKR